MRNTGLYSKQQMLGSVDLQWPGSIGAKPVNFNDPLNRKPKSSEWPLFCSLYLIFRS
jgi:hypothetical protein